MEEKRKLEIMEKARKDNRKYHEHSTIADRLGDLVNPTYSPPSNSEGREIYKTEWKLSERARRRK